jgi:hypothetical protein
VPRSVNRQAVRRFAPPRSRGGSYCSGAGGTGRAAGCWLGTGAG